MAEGNRESQKMGAPELFRCKLLVNIFQALCVDHVSFRISH